MEFCDRLSTAEYLVRLPTEEEWEYACRAQSQLPFAAPPGESAELRRALEKYRQGDVDFLTRFLSREACFNDAQPRTVATLAPNAWGLHDMHGNIWEWCCADPPDAESCPLRGGAWSSPNVFCCRAAQRDWQTRNTRKDSIGFRVLLELRQR